MRALLSLVHVYRADGLRRAFATTDSNRRRDEESPLDESSSSDSISAAMMGANMYPNTAMTNSAKIIFSFASLHHISSEHLSNPDHAFDCDVLVCGDDKEARAEVISVVSDLGLRGVDAGVLKNAIALESLTPVLLHINRRYKSVGSGIRITGIPETE